MVGSTLLRKEKEILTGSLRSDKGKFYAVLNLKDEFGKRKQKTVNLHIDDVPGNKRKAERAFRDVLAQYEENHIVICKKDTMFSDYIKVWLEEAKPGLEQITCEAYQSYVDLHIYPFFKELGVNLQDLNYQHIQKYYALKIKTLSANSLKKHHVVINQTLRKALKHDLISNNPAEKVTLPKTEKFKGSYLTVEQGNALLDLAQGRPIEPAVVFGMVYGLRRSEIAGLKWSAIDFKGNTISVQHTVTKLRTTVAKDRTKNKSSNRTLPLNPAMRKYLVKLRAQQMSDKTLLGQAYRNTDYVCRWSDGHAISCDYLSKGFKRLLRRNGLPDIRLHDLRHSCASFMLKMGCSMKEIADWLGHADIKTAMNVYAHWDMAEKKDVA
jgi:integrase